MSLKIRERILQNSRKSLKNSKLAKHPMKQLGRLSFSQLSPLLQGQKEERALPNARHLHYDARRAQNPKASPTR